MFKNNKGKSVKEKLKLLKKFALGESVIEDIVEEMTPKITGFEFVMVKALDKNLTDDQFNELNAIADHVERYKQYKQIRWIEERTYQDSQFPDVRMVNAENAAVELPETQESNERVSVLSKYSENNEAVETPKNGLRVVSKDQHRRLFLQGINEQIKQDQERRTKMRQYSMMNGFIRPF